MENNTVTIEVTVSSKHQGRHYFADSDSYKIISTLNFSNANYHDRISLEVPSEFYDSTHINDTLKLTLSK